MSVNGVDTVVHRRKSGSESSGTHQMSSSLSIVGEFRGSRQNGAYFIQLVFYRQQTADHFDHGLMKVGGRG